MAMEVLTQIKDAEQKALETRRVAAAAAKDAIKLAEQENEEISDMELTAARREGIDIVEAAQKAAKAELDALQQQRMQECDKLKRDAEKNLFSGSGYLYREDLKVVWHYWK